MSAKPMMRRYDITIAPQDNPLYQRVIEVDAVGEEEACELVRHFFHDICRQYVFVRAVSAHRHRKPQPITIWFRLGSIFGKRW